MTPWQKVLPLLSKGTGITAVALVTLAAADATVVQAGAQGLPPALLAFLASLFGDVVAGPIIDRLLNQEIAEETLDNFVQQLEAELQLHQLNEDINQVLEQQNALANAIGVALQEHEHAIVQRILSGVAHYQDLGGKRLVDQLSQNYPNLLDPKTRYLTKLIHELGGREDIGERYINLSSHTTPETAAKTDISKSPRRLLDPAFSKPQAWKTETQPESINLANLPYLLNVRTTFEIHPRFVILGEPGSGKSTTLRQLAFEAAWNSLKAPEAPIPLYCELPKWKSTISWEEFINSYWNLDLDLEVALVEGQVALFVDGLNEVGTHNSQKLAALRQWIHSRNHPEYFVITCRVKDYIDKYNLDLPIALIEKLNEEQVSLFVESYLGDDAKKFLSRVLPRPRRWEYVDDRFVSLTRNPYTLRALILIYETSGELPHNLGRLFRDLVDYLWSREWLRNTPGWILHSEMLPALSRFAFGMIEDEVGTVVSREYSEQYVNPELLSVAANADLIRLEAQNVSFSHELMRDYFAAEALASSDKPIEIKRRQFYSTAEAVPDKWDEAITGLAGLIPDASDFLIALSENDPYLATRCVSYGAVSSDKCRQVIGAHLTNDLTYRLHNHTDEYWIRRLNAAKALGTIADPNTIDALIDALTKEWVPYPKAAIASALGEIGEEKAFDPLVKALNNDETDDGVIVLRAVVDALGKIPHPKRVEILVSQLSDQKDTFNFNPHPTSATIRDIAAHALLSIDTVETREILEEWKTKLRDELRYEYKVKIVTETAPSRYLLAGKRQSSNILNFKKQIIRAVTSLGYLRDHDSVPQLINLLQERQPLEVQWIVIDALGRIGDKRAIPILKSMEGDTSEVRVWMGFGSAVLSDYYMSDAAADAVQQISDS